jgi:hypothetical protein
MSDENGQEIGVNVYDDEDELIEDEEAAAPQPVEVVREEIMTVTKNPDAEDNGSEDDLYEVAKAHSDLYPMLPLLLHLIPQVLIFFWQPLVNVFFDIGFSLMS